MSNKLPEKNQSRNQKEGGIKIRDKHKKYICRGKTSQKNGSENDTVQFIN